MLDALVDCHLAGECNSGKKEIEAKKRKRREVDQRVEQEEVPRALEIFFSIVVSASRWAGNLKSTNKKNPQKIKPKEFEK